MLMAYIQHENNNVTYTAKSKSYQELHLYIDSEVPNKNQISDKRSDFMFLVNALYIIL